MLSRIAQSGPPPFDRRYNPTEVFDFTKGTRGLLRGTALTCSGGVNGTVVDPSGNIVAASAPRITHDPMGVTNFCLQSERCDLSPWVGTATATAASEYFGRSQFWTFAKTTSAGSEGRIQPIRAVFAGESMLVTLALLSGSTNTVGVGLYGDVGAWGTNPNSTASVVSGPGSIAQSTGGLWNVTGLSATVPTIVTLRRVYPSADTMAHLFIYPGTSGSTTIGHSVKLAQPMVEFNLAARSGRYVPTTNAAASARDCLGVLVEPQSTNVLPNSVLAGAVVGTIGSGGSLPTGWSFSGTGLTCQVIATGTQAGMSYVDIRVSGTAGSTFCAFQTAGNLNQAASSGQTWTASVYTTLVSGSLTNVGTFYLRASGRNNAASNQENTDVSLLTLKGGPLNASSRFSVTRTLNNANTTQISSAIETGHVNGAVLDFTFRVALPQLEQQAVPTSPIFTSGAAVTRSQDNVEVTGSAVAAVFNPSGGTMLVEASIPAVVNSPAAGLLTAINVTPGSVDWLGISRYPTYPGVNRRRNNVDLASMTISSTHVANTMERGALSYRSDGGNDQFAINGTLATPMASSTTPYTAVDTIRIGRFGSNPGWAGGTIKRASFWPTALSADVLQTLTT